jgi:hypothetical protein
MYPFDDGLDGSLDRALVRYAIPLEKRAVLQEKLSSLAAPTELGDLEFKNKSYLVTEGTTEYLTIIDLKCLYNPIIFAPGSKIDQYWKP